MQAPQADRTLCLEGLRRVAVVSKLGKPRTGRCMPLLRRCDLVSASPEESGPATCSSDDIVAEFLKVGMHLP